jgi:cell division protein FtsB
MNPQRKWGSLVVVLFVVYLVFSGNRGLWNLYKLHQDKQNLTEQISQLQSEIDRYQAEYQAYSKNNSVIEKQAREELNLVKPGEMVYKFGKTDSH